MEVQALFLWCTGTFTRSTAVHDIWWSWFVTYFKIQTDNKYVYPLRISYEFPCDFSLVQFVCVIQNHLNERKHHMHYQFLLEVLCKWSLVNSLQIQDNSHIIQKSQQQITTATVPTEIFDARVLLCCHNSAQPIITTSPPWANKQQQGLRKPKSSLLRAGPNKVATRLLPTSGTRMMCCWSLYRGSSWCDSSRMRI